MGLKISCDGGCSFESSDIAEFSSSGFAHKRFYCKNCTPLVADYLKRRDNAHSATVIYFKNQMDKVVATFRKEHSKMSLPDIPGD